jgi:redox-sensitive bicupin YhaK (pirin superfamily)
VQWLTAGRGIQHAEMFPLLDTQAGNRVELFQIWLNLPKADKLVAPYFSMLWQPAIPHLVLGGGKVEVTTVAGALDDRRTAPPPESWASKVDHGVAIWTIKLAPHTTWMLPAARAGLNRVLYFFDGDQLALDSRAIPARSAVELVSDAEVAIETGPRGVELLMLQGQPIGEPVAQRGPFVMNTREEIAQTIEEYRATQFGGWRWPSPEPVHGTEGRFARHADGRLDRPA